MTKRDPFFAAMAVLFGIEGSDKGFIGYAGRNFLFSPWYLWCLAICFVITFLSARIQRIPFLAVLICVYCSLPYFACGLFVLRKWPLWKSRLLGVMCLLAYLTVVVTSNSFRQNSLSFYNGTTEWASFVAEPISILLLLARILLGFIGAVGVMWFIHEIVCNFPRVGIWLSPLGKTTLGVYILHQWILARSVEYIPAGSSFVATLGFALICCFACHYITILSKSIPWLRRIIWGLWWER